MKRENWAGKVNPGEEAHTCGRSAAAASGRAFAGVACCLPVSWCVPFAAFLSVICSMYTCCTHSGCSLHSFHASSMHFSSPPHMSCSMPSSALCSASGGLSQTSLLFLRFYFRPDTLHVEVCSLPAPSEEMYGDLQLCLRPVLAACRCTQQGPNSGTCSIQALRLTLQSLNFRI